MSDPETTSGAGAIENVDLFVRGSHMLTMDTEDRVLTDSIVAVVDDRIVAIGSEADIRKAYSAKREVGGKDTIVMPGLVDSYAHAGHGMIKAIYHAHHGWPASEVYFHATTPSWWEADGQLTGLERLKFGVTTGHSTLGGTPARADDPEYAAGHVRGVGRVGTRDVLGMGPPDPFITHLREPWSSTDWRGGSPRTVTFTYEECMNVTDDVVRQFHGANGGRSTVCLAIPYLCGMSPKVMSGSHHFRYTKDDVATMVMRGIEAQAFAREHGIAIHTHGARGTFEYLEERAGKASVLELLGPNVIVAHGHGLTLADIDLVAETDTSVVWVPFGSWGTKVGPMPVVELLRAGVRCAIATDGAAPYHVSDLFLDVHRAMFLVAENYHDASLLPAGKALRMITIDAAEVLGMASEIGSLEVGKKADIIVIDTAQPHLTPTNMPAQLVTYFARGNDVATVVVDGRVLMENRVVESVDERAVLDFARTEIEASFTRIDISPYLEMTREFWRGWRY